MNYTFSFNVNEVNLILEALSELPHKRVAALSSSILYASRSQEASAKAAEEAAAKAMESKTKETPKEEVSAAAPASN